MSPASSVRPSLYAFSGSVISTMNSISTRKSGACQSSSTSPTLSTSVHCSSSGTQSLWCSASVSTSKWPAVYRFFTSLRSGRSAKAINPTVSSRSLWHMKRLSRLNQRFLCRLRANFSTSSSMTLETCRGSRWWPCTPISVSSKTSLVSKQIRKSFRSKQ